MREKHKQPRPEPVPDAELEQVAVDIEALESPAPDIDDPEDAPPAPPPLTNHKYTRVGGNGGWTCLHCKRAITEPRFVGERTCPGPA